MSGRLNLNFPLEIRCSNKTQILFEKETRLLGSLVSVCGESFPVIKIIVDHSSLENLQTFHYAISNELL